ncbi:MAG: gluconokinase [Rhodospirillales bacterium]|nr:gluconokinase [Rhodospirillales bacterium]
MGVSGSGKTTIATLLSARTGWRFQEGDELHPPANVEKMRLGIPLDDQDRLPWLEAIAAVIDRWRADRTQGVITCSALKRQYREIIIGRRPNVALVYLRGSKELIAKRMATRHGHFMPLALLDSQFATLEEPGPDERPIVVDVRGDPERIAAEILSGLALWGRVREPPATPDPHA